MTYNILLIGNGGREHAIACSLAKSPLLNKLFIAPGNPGTAEAGTNVRLKADDFEQVWEFIQEHEIHLTVIGPEKPLVDGIANFLEAKGHPVLGPKLQAAMLEGSKEFAKEFMARHSIPTAGYRVFDKENFDKARKYIIQKAQYPIVLKADGLAAGKGVFIPESEREAVNVLEQMKSDVALSDAASRLVIEEFMEGEEASVFAVSDGTSYKIIGVAQDHKRVGEGDTGLNTGGMGAYSPAPIVNQEMLKRVEKEIIAPTINGMKEEGNPYKGILYCGLMITASGPKVVEFNCRFGDPECQVILPRLKSDLLKLIYDAAHEKLDESEVVFDEQFSCCVVLTSGGYPQAYEKGKVISGLDKVEKAMIFHAGTTIQEGKLLTNGGRVLNLVGFGSNLKEAIQNTYKEAEKIHFEKVYYRKDIGVKGLKYY